MRIAAISDVHGNLLALDAVLADLAGQSVDVVVDLGDLLSGAAQPRETRRIPVRRTTGSRWAGAVSRSGPPGSAVRHGAG
ncbi:metallophosphoesterase [Blastococcus montanus]|uniref:metallophosphoesterase family protein n=1 Tax=Blastococcus montanus TaxID=3144973 RepID=UPI00320B79AC